METKSYSDEKTQLEKIVERTVLTCVLSLERKENCTHIGIAFARRFNPIAATVLFSL